MAPFLCTLFSFFEKKFCIWFLFIKAGKTVVNKKYEPWIGFFFYLKHWPRISWKIIDNNKHCTKIPSKPLIIISSSPIDHHRDGTMNLCSLFQRNAWIKGTFYHKSSQKKGEWAEIMHSKALLLNNLVLWLAPSAYLINNVQTMLNIFFKKILFFNLLILILKLTLHNFPYLKGTSTPVIYTH